MARYNDPKTGKTVEASNLKEAKKALAPKVVVKSRITPKKKEED